MKKHFSFLLGLSILSGSLMSVSCSAHHHSVFQIEDVKGVYKLTTYETKDEEGEFVNIIDGVTAYLTITGEEFGYMYYKDANKPEFVDSIRISYIEDYETVQKGEVGYSAIEYTRGTEEDHIWNAEPGNVCEPQFGLSKKHDVISYTRFSQNASGHEVPYHHVAYTKVSEEATYEKMAEIAQTSLEKPISYQFKNFDKYLQFTKISTEPVPYDYIYVNFTNSFTKANFYYATEAEFTNSQLHSLTNLNVTYSEEIQPNLTKKYYLSCPGANSVFGFDPKFEVTLNGTMPRTIMSIYLSSTESYLCFYNYPIFDLNSFSLI